METTCLLDLEEDNDDSSTCSFFTVATVLSRTKNETSLMQKNDAWNDDRTACTFPSVTVDTGTNNHGLLSRIASRGGDGVSVHSDGHCTQNSVVADRDEELKRLRCTSSLMDDSFDSMADDELHGIHDHEIVSPTPAGARGQVNLQKTVKKSNCNRSKANNLGSIFRTPGVRDKEKHASSEAQLSMQNINDSLFEQASFKQPLHPTKTPIRAPYDETNNNSFDASIGNSLMDATYESFDELDKDGIKRRKRLSNKFLSVYDELSAQAIQKSATFQSALNKKDKDGKVKRMSDAFSTAMQSMADGISSHAAANARCDMGGSWDVDEPLSGKKRPLAEISGLQNLRKSWGGSHNYIQMQLIAEREEERNLYNQVSAHFVLTGSMPDHLD